MGGQFHDELKLIWAQALYKFEWIAICDFILTEYTVLMKSPCPLIDVQIPDRKAAWTGAPAIQWCNSF